jgi:hypothetical protein
MSHYGPESDAYKRLIEHINTSISLPCSRGGCRNKVAVSRSSSAYRLGIYPPLYCSDNCKNMAVVLKRLEASDSYEDFVKRMRDEVFARMPKEDLDALAASWVEAKEPAEDAVD